MRNHWTDQKVIKIYIRRESERVAYLCGVEAAYVARLLVKDIETNPLTDDEWNKLYARIECGDLC